MANKDFQYKLILRSIECSRYFTFYLHLHCKGRISGVGKTSFNEMLYLVSK